MSVLENAAPRGLSHGDVQRVIDEAGRRAAARRFAAFKDREVSALLIAVSSTLRRRRGLSAGSWVELAGISIELRSEVEARLRRPARQDGVS